METNGKFKTQKYAKTINKALSEGTSQWNREITLWEQVRKGTRKGQG